MTAPNKNDVAMLTDLAAASRERYRGIRADRFKRQDRDGNSYPVVREPVTDRLIREHVAGTTTIAAFFVDEAGTTAIGEADLDWPDKECPDDDALADAVGRLRETFDAAGIHCLMTESG